MSPQRAGDSAATTECALCGATNQVGEAACGSCGAVLLPPQRDWAEPALERRIHDVLQRHSRRGGGGANVVLLLRLVAASVAGTLETAKAIVTAPERSFLCFRRRGGFALATAFVFVSGGLSLAAKALLGGWADRPTPMRGATLAAVVLVAPAAYVYVRAQVIHLSALFQSAAKERFEVSYRVVAYTSASLAPLLAVPVFGELLFLTAGVWIESIGLARTHGMELTKALLVEMIPAFVLIVGMTAFLGVQLFWLAQPST